MALCGNGVGLEPGKQWPQVQPAPGRSALPQPCAGTRRPAVGSEARGGIMVTLRLSEGLGGRAGGGEHPVKVGMDCGPLWLRDAVMSSSWTAARGSPSISSSPGSPLSWKELVPQETRAVPPGAACPQQNGHEEEGALNERGRENVEKFPSLHPPV
uniref:Uncharacterized protein n=1 Tax=Molossus molossus TaxID=27622 RepID=A0A7J8I8X8_MOLMO|nr:hypothetical protein HJG59_010599 [Molossus molossus]